MTPTAVQKAACTWLATQMGLAAGKVLAGVVTPDIAVRLTMPYATVTAITEREVGDDAYALEASDWAGVQGLREMVLSVNVYGVDAMNYLAKARRSVSRPDAIRLAEAAGFEAVSVGGIAPLMHLLDTGFEERAQAELLVRYTETEEDTGAGEITTAVAPGTLDPDDLVIEASGSVPT